MSRWTVLQCSVGNDAGSSLSSADHDVQLVDLAEGDERLGDGGLGGGGFLHGAERERDAAHVDHVVRDDGRDDLAAQRVGVEFGVEPFPQLLREVGAQRLAEPRVLREVAVAQRRREFDLGVGGQHGEFRRGQALALFEPLAQRLGGRQRLQVTLEIGATSPASPSAARSWGSIRRPASGR